MVGITRIFLIVLFAVIGHQTDAQVATGQDFQRYFGRKTRDIATEIYRLGVSGRIKGYWTDSMNRKMTLDELNRQGMQMKYAKKFDGSDTAYFLPFNTDSLIPDLGFVYQVKSGKKSGIQLHPEGVSICCGLLYPNGITYKLPLFYVSYSDLMTGLFSREDQEFLKIYSIYKLFDHSYFIGLDDGFRREIEWSDYADREYYLSGTGLNENTIGLFLYRSMQEKLFHYYWQGKLELYDNTINNVPISDFGNLHSQWFKTQIVLNWKDTESLYDPANLKDTTFQELPRYFDSLSFEVVNGARFIRVHQRVGHSQEMKSYHLNYGDVKDKLHANLSPWIDLFFRHYLKGKK